MGNLVDIDDLINTARGREFARRTPDRHSARVAAVRARSCRWSPASTPRRRAPTSLTASDPRAGSDPRTGHRSGRGCGKAGRGAHRLAYNQSLSEQFQASGVQGDDGTVAEADRPLGGCAVTNATSTAPQLGDVDDSWPKLHCRTRFRPSAVRRRARRVKPSPPSTRWEMCMCLRRGSRLCSSLTLAAVDRLHRLADLAAMFEF
jgi:hypothetical protein